jgi:tetratricopeptide (TPR) repeat protein
VASYEKAILIEEAVMASKSATDVDRRNLARLQFKLGHAMLSRGDFRGALFHDQIAVDLFSELARRDPATADRRYVLGYAYLHVALDQSMVGNQKSGLETYAKALMIFREEEADNDESQHHYGLYNEGVTDLWMSLAWSSLGNFVQAHEAAEKSLEIRKTISQRNSTNVRAQLDLADSYAALGNVELKQRRLEAAVKNYHKSQTIAAAAATADPKDQRAQEDLATAYHGLAETFRYRSELSEALNYAEQALRISFAMASADPTNASDKNDLAQAYASLGDIYKARALKQAKEPRRTQSDIERALDSYQKANAIYSDLHARAALPFDATAEFQRIPQEISACRVALTKG